MTMREIARDEWQPFFDAFSGMHRGRPTTVEVRGGAEQEGVRAFEMPLEEIIAIEPAGGQIQIVLRGVPDESASHVIQAPEHVWLVQGEGDPDLALEIASHEGTTTLLRIRDLELPKPTGDFFA